MILGFIRRSFDFERQRESKLIEPISDNKVKFEEREDPKLKQVEDKNKQRRTKSWPE